MEVHLQFLPLDEAIALASRAVIVSRVGRAVWNILALTFAMYICGQLSWFRSVSAFVAGNKTNRYYGPVDKPFRQIGRGIIRSALVAIVKGACLTATTDQHVQKAIREGLNTVRLHDRDVTNRRLRKQQLEEEAVEHVSDTSQPEFVEERESDLEPDDWNHFRFPVHCLCNSLWKWYCNVTIQRLSVIESYHGMFFCEFKMAACWWSFLCCVLCSASMRFLFMFFIWLFCEVHVVVIDGMNILWRKA